MASRRLLICFDAFDTIFTPKTPVIQQYGEVARSLGLRGFSDDDLSKAFITAYKNESAQNPNFGKATNMGAERWWTNIITKSFETVTDEPLPSQLAPKLLHRFHCDEGYTLFADVKPLLKKLRDYARESDRQILVGVITNSDDRVPDVLKALGLKVNATRYGDKIAVPLGVDNDFDFTVMSYDVGHEKPDTRIFDAAVELANGLSKLIGHAQTEDWEMVYVGDEHKKDVVGALAAGWKVALIDRTDSHHLDNVLKLSNDDAATLFEAFTKSRALGFRDLAALAERIPV